MASVIQEIRLRTLSIIDLYIRIYTYIPWQYIRMYFLILGIQQRNTAANAAANAAVNAARVAERVAQLREIKAKIKIIADEVTTLGNLIRFTGMYFVINYLSSFSPN